MYKSNVGFVELVGKIESAEQFRRSSSILTRLSSSKSLLIDQESIHSDMGSNNELHQNDDGVQMESTSKGKVKGSMFLKYFTAGVRWPMLAVLICSFLLAQVIASGYDYFQSIW